MTLEKAVYRNRGTFLGLAASLIGLAMLLALISSAAFVWPIRALVRQVRRVKDGVGDYEPIERPVTREVAELSESVAEMSEALSSRAEYIRHFAHNVSHEFKTPLTSMHGTIELLEDHFDTMDTARRASFLGMLERDTERLTRLVDRLHELARADVERPTGQRADASKIAREIAERFEVDAVDIDDGVEVPTSPEVFETILSNLVSNALKHGEAPVQIALGVRDDRVELRVTDHGEGIAASNLEQVFDEFFTTARDHGGTGLGLSIVRALVDSHGGEVKVRQYDRCTFIVRL